MLVERCKKSEILVAFLSSAIFRELPVYVGQAVPFFNCEKDVTCCAEMELCIFTAYLKCKKRIRE